MARRPSSVCPSVCLSVCELFAQIASSRRQMAGSRPNLQTMVPRRVYIQGVLKFKVEVNGHVIPAHLEFHQKSLTQSFPNFSFPLSIRFSSASKSPHGSCALSDAIAHKQFVSLIAIQYGLTCCLCVRSLYEAPLHSPFSIRQLDIMSKSWNELLCR